MHSGIHSFDIVMILLIVFSGFNSIYTVTGGEGFIEATVKPYDYGGGRRTAGVGDRYTGRFSANKFPIDFFIIDPEDVGPNWSYSIDAAYEVQSGMNGTFYFVVPYPGDWLFMCYNPNPEKQTVRIEYIIRTFSDDVQVGMQVFLFEALVVGIGIGGWRYTKRRVRRERETDIFRDQKDSNDI